jgi:hypothetical protein
MRGGNCRAKDGERLGTSDLEENEAVAYGYLGGLPSLGMVDVEIGADGVVHYLNLVSNPGVHHYVYSKIEFVLRKAYPGLPF